MPTAIEMIAEKHRTNRQHKGYTPEHDAEHTMGELADAARCHIERAKLQAYVGADVDFGRFPLPPDWPFEPYAWSPSDDPVRNLVHAGALIVAEIERLQSLPADTPEAS